MVIDQFSLVILYKKIYMDYIPEQIENAYTVKFFGSPIRTNLDDTEQWWTKKNLGEN